MNGNNRKKSGFSGKINYVWIIIIVLLLIYFGREFLNKRAENSQASHTEASVEVDESYSAGTVPGIAADGGDAAGTEAQLAIDTGGDTTPSTAAKPDSGGGGSPETGETSSEPEASEDAPTNNIVTDTAPSEAEPDTDDTSEPAVAAVRERYTEEGEAVPDFGTLSFRNDKRLYEHYKKHGIDMGFNSPEAYLSAANEAVHNPDALIKLEKEDKDYVFYVEATNEFAVVSRDGYLRTYFYPNGGKSYYLRQ